MRRPQWKNAKLNNRKSEKKAIKKEKYKSNKEMKNEKTVNQSIKQIIQIKKWKKGKFKTAESNKK